MYSCQNLIDLAPGWSGDVKIHSDGDAGAQAARAISPSKMRGPSDAFSANLQSFGGGSRDGTRLTHPSQWSWAGLDQTQGAHHLSLLCFPWPSWSWGTGPKTLLGPVGAHLLVSPVRPTYAWEGNDQQDCRWSTRELVRETWEPLVCVDLTYLSRCPLSWGLEVPRVAVTGRPNGSHQPSEFMNYNWDSGLGWAFGGLIARNFL